MTFTAATWHTQPLFMRILADNQSVDLLINKKTNEM